MSQLLRSLTLTSVKKIIENTYFKKMPHLTPIQTARAIAKLEENWLLDSVARDSFLLSIIY
jgi:hypothetical protein